MLRAAGCCCSADCRAGSCIVHRRACSASLRSLAIVVAAGFGLRDPRSRRARRATGAARPSEDETRRRGARARSRSAGWCIGFLSLKARICRLFTRRAARRRRASPCARAGGAARDRVEPTLRGASRSSTTARTKMTTTRTRRTSARSRRRARARRARPRPPQRASRAAIVLPPLNLLAAPRRATRFAPSAEDRSRRTPRRSKACWRISACAARSSMRGPARW